MFPSSSGYFSFKPEINISPYIRMSDRSKKPKKPDFKIL